MARVKISIPKLELLRTLSDGSPDLHAHIFDYDYGSGYVDGYLWQTLETRTRWQGEFSTHVAWLGKEGFIKWFAKAPPIWRRLFGAEVQHFAYLTPLGHEAAVNPASYLSEPFTPDDHDRGQEPRGIFLRQAMGLSPLDDSKR